MNIDDHDNCEKIYANFIDHEFAEMPSFMQAQWGNHITKPRNQTKWEHSVAQSVASIIDEGVNISAVSSEDLRPKLVDKISGRSILVDSGASRSIWPIADFPGRSPDLFKALKAVNHSTIHTYGLQNIKIQPSNHFSFEHSFILADIDQVVLGWDWLAAARLDIVWRDNKCFLASGNKLKVELKMSKTTSAILNLAPIDINVGAQIDNNKIPSQYQRILDKYPNLTKFNFRKKIPAHNVVHVIETNDSKPCKAKLRPIMHGTPKAIKGEQSWNE